MDMMTDGAKAFVQQAIKGAEPEPWGAPDMSVLQQGRRPAPAFLLDVLGPEWAAWVLNAADAAAAPVDYVVLPLLASASALIGNARWSQAWPGWEEPPHLWCGVVGDSGSSKSPGADCLLRDVLPKIEARMRGDFPDRLKEWQAKAEIHKVQKEAWEKDVRKAIKDSYVPPLPPADALPPEPQEPRLRQSDVTVEKVASLLASASPKGVLIVRDELAGWLLGMNNYNDSGRAFWIEAYGGRPYRVERKMTPEPVVVPRLALAVMGGTQPDKVAEMFRGADDGLLARFIWAWPESRPFKRGTQAPDVDFAINALDRLRLLEMTPASGNEPAAPLYVPLSDAAASMLETFAQDMQKAQGEAGGLHKSAYGKARGLALRLSLVLEMLRWAANPGYSAPPSGIGEKALADACDLVSDYFMPMAARVYGDAAIPESERNAATLARWIVKVKPQEVHIRTLQREARLPGLRDADTIKAACTALIEADWLRPPAPGAYQSKPKGIYPVNPAIWEGDVP